MCNLNKEKRNSVYLNKNKLIISINGNYIVILP